MSLEQALAANTAALTALTAAMAAGGAVSSASTGTAAAGDAAKPGRKPKADTAAVKGPTREEMVAALTEVKEKFGAAEAKAIITKVGAEKMAGIADDKIGTAFTLAKAKIDADTGADEGEDDGL